MKKINEENSVHAFLITGGNIGDRAMNLAKAARLINERAGLIVHSSGIYETAAWGKPDQPPFYNQVHEIISTMDAETLMHCLLSIEKEMGRVRTEKNAARTIDIDILFYGEKIIQNRQLIIPHKEIANRRFVLMPLAEIAPSFIHPVLKQTIKELLAACTDPLEVMALAAH